MKKFTIVMRLGYLLLCGIVAISAQDNQAAKSAQPQKHWAYLQVKRPAVPQVQQKEWVRTPIDSFVLARVEAKGIKPSPDADRATFIRRATLDVWGTIPSPSDVEAFVNDKSSNAYETLVDRLLASPHYGERQARRWLDLARYADSTGFENDRTRPNMWRYRDYVINAFNQDKPYDLFIKEQIAGDEIAPENQDVMVATGFLAGYPDNYNSRDLVQRKYQITTDMTDTVGAVFLGQTVACARCHNHKFDRISQKEYFQLQSFFANVSEENNYSAKPGAQELEYRNALAKWEEASKDVRAEMAQIINSIRDVGTKYYRERYLTDSRDAIFKPKSEWTALDRWINHRADYVMSDNNIAAFFGDAGTNKNAPEYDPKYEEPAKRYKQLQDELKKFDDLRPKGSDKYTSMTELNHPDSPATHLLFVGNHERPLEEVQPGFPAAIADGEEPVIVPMATTSGRRTALANWIASSNNPLTARVFVNRVWGQYFGHGIVETVSDFGKAGAKPTNPELLDYLADQLVKQGWSVKKLHREILLSSVYRQSSDYREDAAKADPENKLLAVYPRVRLEAEEIRDSLLFASGKLDDDIVGGPSVFPPIPKGLPAGNLWQVSKDPRDFNRRSLYVFTRRSVPYPLLDTFDMASPQQVHSKRTVTTTPLQALTLYNDELVFEWSRALAGRVIREAGADESARLDRLYQILFARNPDSEEKRTLLTFLNDHEKLVRAREESKQPIALPVGGQDPEIRDPAREAAFVDLVHTVINSNDFAYKF